MTQTEPRGTGKPSVSGVPAPNPPEAETGQAKVVRLDVSTVSRQLSEPGLDPEAEWGEIRAAGLQPSPGARHKSGDIYKHVPGPDPVRYPADGMVVTTNVIRFCDGCREALIEDGAHGRDDRPVSRGEVELPDDDGCCPLALAWFQDTADLEAATTPRGMHANAAANYLKLMDAEGHKIGGWIDNVVERLPYTGFEEFEAMFATAPVPADKVAVEHECCGSFFGLGAPSANGHGQPGVPFPPGNGIPDGQPVTGQSPPEMRDTNYSGQPPGGGSGGLPPALKLVQASDITPERVVWLWKDKLKRGGLALLAGDVDLGKSTIGIDIAARLTLGTLPGEYEGKPQDVIICATEDEWADTVVPRLMAANADLTRVCQLTTAQEYGAELSLPVQVPELARLVAQREAKLIILDPLISRLDGRLDSHKDPEVRRALEPLVKMAGQAGVTVLGLIHENKSGDANAVNRVMASKAFVAIARSVLYAARLLTQDSSGETYVLACMKNNNARRSAESYKIEPVMLAVPGGITSIRIHWLGALESFMLDAELAAAGKRKGATAVEKAAAWLESYLTQHGGRASSADIRKAGKADGHAVATLKRAKEEAGVTVENTQTKPRRTVWVLDDYDSQSAHARGGSPKFEPTAGDYNRAASGIKPALSAYPNPPVPPPLGHPWCRANASPPCLACEEARPKRIAEAKRLRAQGVTIREIARRCGVSVTTARDDLGKP
jgi:hypothetical protein